MEQRQLIKLKFLLQQDIDNFQHRAQQLRPPRPGEHSAVRAMLAIREQQLELVKQLIAGHRLRIKEFPRHW